MASNSGPRGQGAALEAVVLEFERWLQTRPWRGLTALWRAQTRRMQLALALTALFVLASVMNLCGSLGRSTTSQVVTLPPTAVAQPAASAPTLIAESAPAEAGKSWAVTEGGQGSGRPGTGERT